MNRIALVLILTLAGPSLCGCKTDQPPDRAQIQKEALTNVAVRKNWAAGGSTTAPVADNWLASFQDPELDALVREAAANNPDLRVASTRVELAGQYLELARAALRPSVGVFGTGGFKSGGNSDLTSALQGILIGVSWEPDLWGRMRYARNAAEDTSVAAQADFEFARQSIAATVARSWFFATETWLQQQIALDVLKTAEDLVKLVTQRQQIGAGSDEDVALAKANLGTLQDNVKQFEFAHEQSLRALEAILGRYPSAELKARHDLPTLGGPVPAGMPLETLERRPDMVSAERQVAAAFNRVGEAKAARLPRITLNASAAFIDSSVLQLKPGFENPTGGAGARLIAPIYDGGALNTQVAIRTLEQKQAVAEYARMALRAIGDVENALAAGRMLAEREALLRQATSDNQHAMDLVQISYRVGKGDLRAVQQQELNVLASRIALLHVQSEQLVRRVDLHLALGGSFETRVPPTTQQVAKGQ